MKRLVFSRKGFDSVSGGVPSPVLPDGRMVSLPIPEPSAAPGVGTPYEEIAGPGGLPLADLMAEVGAGLPMGAVAHLDPDLDAASRPRLAGWRPLFGTDDTSRSASHLTSLLAPGDLILFYGWFAPACPRGGQLRLLDEDASVHAAFGYLEVDQLIGVSGRAAADALPGWMADHPHVRDPDRPGNLLIVPREKSTIVPGAPGAGVFPFLRQELVLTRPGARWHEWLLPLAFAPEGQLVPFTYRSDPSRWSVSPAGVALNTAGRGQEYVADCNDGIAGWAANLIQAGLAGTSANSADVLGRLTAGPTRFLRGRPSRPHGVPVASRNPATSKVELPAFVCVSCSMTLPTSQQSTAGMCGDCAG